MAARNRFRGGKSGLRTALMRGTVLTALSTPGLLMAAAAMGGPASTAPVPGFPISDATSSQNLTNTLDCSAAGDCLYISTLGNAYHITLDNSGNLTATGTGSGIVAKTVGVDSFINILNTGRIDAAADGIFASTVSQNVLGAIGLSGTNVAAAPGADATGGNGVSGISAAAGAAGRIEIINQATIEAGHHGLNAESSGGAAHGGAGGSGTGGAGEAAHITGDSTIVGDNGLPGTDGATATAGTDGSAGKASSHATASAAGNGGGAAAGGVGGSGGTAAGGAAGTVTISNAAEITASAGIAVSIAGGAATAGHMRRFHPLRHMAEPALAVRVAAAERQPAAPRAP